jgi:TonB family protein
MRVSRVSLLASYFPFSVFLSYCLQSGGRAGGIGFGGGIGSGFGGGSGGIDALASLMSSGGSNTEIQKRDESKEKESSGAYAGSRSRAEIFRVVRQNMSSLQDSYNRRLKDNPEMQGRVTVKWAIDEFGNVIFCKLVGSTIGDDTFEQAVVNGIKTWNFGKINAPGDVAEIEFPFLFTPN